MQRVAKVKALEYYLLLLQFQNGEKRVFDCQPLLNDRLYENLKDADFFRSVHVDNMGVISVNVYFVLFYNKQFISYSMMIL